MLPVKQQARRGTRLREPALSRDRSPSLDTLDDILSKVMPHVKSDQLPVAPRPSQSKKQPSSYHDNDLRNVLPVRRTLRRTREDKGKSAKLEVAVEPSPHRDRSPPKSPAVKPKPRKDAPISTRLRSTKRIAELIDDDPRSTRRTARTSINEPLTSTPLSTVSRVASQKPRFSPSPVRRLTRRFTAVQSPAEEPQSSKENNSSEPREALRPSRKSKAAVDSPTKTERGSSSLEPEVVPRRLRRSKPVARSSRKKSSQNVARTVGLKMSTKEVRAADVEKEKRAKKGAIEWSYPCREEEFKEVLGFIKENLDKGTGGCMCVHGMPGTGKTATVHQVIKYLNETEDERPAFRFCEINGMKLSDPKQTYVMLAKTLKPELKKLAPARALRILDKQFRRTVGKDDDWDEEHDFLIALVDEMDLLYVKKQKLLYNLFDWPQQPGSKFIVIAISNTMDLPERIPLMARIESRLGMQRLAFQPYSREQLEKVVWYHLKDVNLDAEALVLASARVASITGDARRVLNITRRARDIAADRQPSKTSQKVQVELRDVQAACEELMACPKKQYMKNASAVEKVFLRSMTAFNEEEVSMDILFRQVIESCPESGIRAPSVAFCLELANRLAAMELIYINSNPAAPFERLIGLNCYREDVIFTTKVDS
ncbi:hypothetical protein RvY_04820 [Ramazzottius varieornatus]|uniref:Origin recognition complex subunit 1 n=1 Tax=Ramazzottius varieornatus TaxID=947166 RepID=A0A1D1UW66_RAMVA|nr:hypothetical protein RvY_04820 [Ramazzottius varieornatus]